MRDALGCGDYTAVIQPRGGGRILDLLVPSRIQFGRRLDEISTAVLTVPAARAADCASMAKIRAWEWELALLRNGRSVWAGPMRVPKYEWATVTVNASDLFAWYEHRTLPLDRTWEQADLATIFASLAADAMLRDPSPNVAVAATGTGIVGDRKVTAESATYAASAMRELSRVGVDWTMVGREMRVGGVEVPVEPLATLTNDTLTNVVVDPIEPVSEVTLLGGTPVVGGAPIVGTATQYEPAIGLVEQVVNESTVLDAASARAGAASRLAFFEGDPFYVSGNLTSTAPVDFSRLVPGARIDLALSSTSRGPVFRPARLATVDVTVEIGSSGMTETVAVSFEPLGTVAA